MVSGVALAHRGDGGDTTQLELFYGYGRLWSRCWKSLGPLLLAMSKGTSVTPRHNYSGSAENGISHCHELNQRCISGPREHQGNEKGKGLGRRRRHKPALFHSNIARKIGIFSQNLQTWIVLVHRNYLRLLQPPSQS